MMPRKTALVIGAAITAISLVGMGLSLIIPVLSLRMQAAGYSGRDIGLNTSVGAVATLALAPFVPRMAGRFGARALMLGAIVLAILCLFGFGLIQNIPLWFPLRLLFGGALTVLFVMSEFWINAIAPPERRGLIMGIYATSLALGFSVGPALLYFIGTDSLWPFGIAAGLYGLSAIPILAAGGQVPDLAIRSKIPLWVILVSAPAATLAALTFGMVETGAMSLMPVYAMRQHYSPQQGALCVSLFALGSLLFEVPLGVLSDRVDRRRLLLGIGAAGAIGALLVPFIGVNFLNLAVFLVLWGGVVGGLYPLALAHIGGHYQGAELANANASIIMFYSIGMLGGPPLLGVAMDWVNPNGLFLAIAIIFCIYCGVVVWRLMRLRRSEGVS